MQTSGPAPRRPWSPADRDSAVRRARRATRVIVAGAAGLSATFSVVAAQAFKGHSGAKKATSARAAPSPVPAPQYVPPIAPVHRRLQPPSAPPSTPANPAPAAPAPSAVPAPAPAPAPAPPPPVASGGS